MRGWCATCDALESATGLLRLVIPRNQAEEREERGDKTTNKIGRLREQVAWPIYEKFVLDDCCPEPAFLDPYGQYPGACGLVLVCRSVD